MEDRFLQWCQDNQVNVDDGENLPEAYGWFAEAEDLNEEELRELVG